jgi:pimeloyl-ACP methyl ester carboxylesterase
VRPPVRLRLPDGRTLAYDDVGDPAGRPVVYLHGTPDSRRARHPDDGIAAAAGIRLLALDRPGAGDSDPHPDGSLTSLGDDLAHLLDDLRVDRAALLGWSTGGLFALAAATRLGPRVAGVALVGPVPPVEAYEDAALVAALDPARQHLVALAAEVPAGELGAELAHHVVPLPFDPALAREHVLEGAGERGRAELARVPGAVDALVAGLAGSVARGTEGLALDLARQLEPGLDLASVAAPVRTWHGAHDGLSPPPVGRWLAGHLPSCRVEVDLDGGHHLIFPRWREVLDRLVEDAAEGG